MVKETIEAFLELEMEEHLGYPKHDPEGRGSGNSRNGATEKTIRGDFGEVQIETPRDRQSSFDPKIVGNWRLGWSQNPGAFPLLGSHIPGDMRECNIRDAGIQPFHKSGQRHHKCDQPRICFWFQTCSGERERCSRFQPCSHNLLYDDYVHSIYQKTTISFL